MCIILNTLEGCVVLCTEYPVAKWSRLALELVRFAALLTSQVSGSGVCRQQLKRASTSWAGDFRCHPGLSENTSPLRTAFIAGSTAALKALIHHRKCRVPDERHNGAAAEPQPGGTLACRRVVGSSGLFATRSARSEQTAQRPPRSRRAERGVNNDYTVCIKRQRQAVAFCIRSRRFFFRSRISPCMPTVFLEILAMPAPVYTDCINRATGRPSGCGRRVLLCSRRACISSSC